MGTLEGRKLGGLERLERLEMLERLEAWKVGGLQGWRLVRFEGLKV